MARPRRSSNSKTSIFEDCSLMSIKADKIFYSSNHFDTVYRYAIE